MRDRVYQGHGFCFILIEFENLASEWVSKAPASILALLGKLVRLVKLLYHIEFRAWFYFILVLSETEKA